MEYTNTFGWNRDFKEVELFFDSIIGNDNAKKLKNEITDFSTDSLDWIMKLTDNLGNSSQKVKNKIISGFCRQFDSIEIFHACKPPKLSPYYSFGIKKLTYAEQKTIFKDFIKENSPEIDDNVIQETIKAKRKFFKSIKHTVKRKHVCFFYDERVANKSTFRENFNGEYFTGILNDINEKFPDSNIGKFAEKLGIPTVFKVVVPIKFIPKKDLFPLMKQLATRWFGLLINDPSIQEQDWNLEWALTFNKNIPAKYIQGHTHSTDNITCSKDIICDVCKVNISPSNS